MTSSECGASQFLEDLKVSHEGLRDPDKEIEENLACCVDGACKMVEAKILTAELEKKVSGLWCVVM